MKKYDVLFSIFGNPVIAVSDFFYNKLHISPFFILLALISLFLIPYIYEAFPSKMKQKNAKEKRDFFIYFGLYIISFIIFLVVSIKDQQKFNNDPDYGINTIIKLKQNRADIKANKNILLWSVIYILLAIFAFFKERLYKGQRLAISFPPEFYLKIKRKKSLVKDISFDDEGVFTLILKTDNRAKPVSEIHSANLVFCKCDNCYDLYYYERNRDQVILKEKINKDNLKSGEKYQLKICWCGAQLKLTVKFTKDGFTLVKEKYEVLK